MEDRSTGMSWIAVLFVIIVIFLPSSAEISAAAGAGIAATIPIPRRRAAPG